ncbi:MAG: energy-coupling factor ABC transporter ATP-binding protein [Lachnospiraceae bacterium]|nr:energy-coupling factor ABC transporter ATP-binding protein [Lachnospiraceae bacterium]
MIEFSNVTFKYNVTLSDGEKEDIYGIRDLNFSIGKGEFVVLTGGSGCGKTIFIRLINGLIPHFYSGELFGEITLNGKSIRDMSIFEISSKVGSVFQNPRSQFFNVNTTDEMAFAAENQRRDPEEIKKRIKDTAVSMKIEKLLDRNIFELSGGEKQLVACAGIGVLSPEIIVLDEPSSNLDHHAINRLSEILSVWKSEGKTIIIAEHRLFYLRNLADRMIVMENGSVSNEFKCEDLKRLSHEDTVKLGIRTLSLDSVSYDCKPGIGRSSNLIFRDFKFTYKNNRHSIDIPKLDVPEGCVTAIIGHNGAGKSTFARNICGLEKRCKGYIEYLDKRLGYKDRLHNCYMIMQDVNHQLFTESVEDEVMLSMTGGDMSEDDKRERVREILDKLDLSKYYETHPMALSGGQKQRVAIASGIASEKPIIVFDEPTSGLDLFHMEQVADAIKDLIRIGKNVFVITHDYEFILKCCDHIIHLENGRVKDSFNLDDGSICKIKEFMCEMSEVS